MTTVIPFGPQHPVLQAIRKSAKKVTPKRDFTTNFIFLIILMLRYKYESYETAKRVAKIAQFWIVVYTAIVFFEKKFSYHYLILAGKCAKN